MRFYVNKSPEEKLYIQANVKSRNELAKILDSEFITAEGAQYHINSVQAERESNDAALSITIGAALGLLAGPSGVFLGTILGGLYGGAKLKEEDGQVAFFNGSRI